MAQVKTTAYRKSFTATALDPAERENRIKAALYTGLIAVVMALILWFYSLQMEVPIPLPEAEEVEVLVDPPAGGGGGGGSPNSEVVPIDPEPVAQTPRSTQQTTDEQAVPQVKTPETPTKPAEPVDNTVAEMRRRREEARQKAEREASNGGGGTGTGQGSGTGSGTGPGSGSGSGGGIGSGRGTGIGHSFGSGRSFRAGGTSTDCHEAGKVVLEVQLMPNGKIIFEDVDPATTGSDCLIRAAKEILRNSSFNSSDNPASMGTITFIFKLN